MPHDSHTSRKPTGRSDKSDGKPSSKSSSKSDSKSKNKSNKSASKYQEQQESNKRVPVRPDPNPDPRPSPPPDDQLGRQPVSRNSAASVTNIGQTASMTDYASSGDNAPRYQTSGSNLTGSGYGYGSSGSGTASYAPEYAQNEYTSAGSSTINYAAPRSQPYGYVPDDHTSPGNPQANASSGYSAAERQMSSARSPVSSASYPMSGYEPASYSDDEEMPENDR